MTGIVLAGGESRRMGSDKAFLTLEGAPLIEHVLRVLKSICSHCIIVTNDPQRYASFSAQVVTDKGERRGPLTGIFTGLYHSTEPYNLIVACDMPFLQTSLLSYMAGLAEGYDVVAPKIGEYTEPLHAIYHRRLLPVAEERIQNNDQRISGIYREALVRIVTEEEIDRFDPMHRSFMNLNTPQQYKEAACLDSECRNSS